MQDRGPQGNHIERESSVKRWRQPMLRDQLINFLEAAVVLLIITNAFSAAAAAHAISLARGVVRTDPRSASEPGLLDLVARRLRVRT